MTAFEPQPGSAPYPPELTHAIAAAVARRAAKPRTRHLLESGQARWANRLALEQSPYLLQHAHNPVDWRPWGDEAFAEARARDVPVFLSIGYATCHWCHVMEEESFEDPEIARQMNEQFVCIKIDREERPDVDAVYMQAVQLLSGHGGWPMTVFLDHQRRPFFAGTYFPPRDGMRGSRHGVQSLCLELARIFRDERPRAEEAAGDLAAAVRKSLLPEAASDLPPPAALERALEYYARAFDAKDGGMRRAPKFPSSMSLRFLLRRALHDDQARLDEANAPASPALEMAWLTLEKMALGGICNQLGGGFHRYSTDAHWLVPHFEKMLYDNALLVLAYTEAWQLLHAREGAAPDGRAWSEKAAFFQRVAEDALGWMEREMSDPRGGFWSATDADSEGEEGTWFVWKLHELEALLGRADGDRAAQLFGVTEEGNFEGSNILSLEHVPSPEERAFLNRVIPILREARAQRPPPLTDDKVLTAWNGLAISAFARAGLAWSRSDLIARAVRAAEFLLTTHQGPAKEPRRAAALAGDDAPGTGQLLRSSLAGTARHAGLLEDHAFLAAGLVDLFEATGDGRWLRAALELHAALESRFADAAGGFFRTPSGHEELLAREKPAYDGAEPTGNSVAALTLLRLGALTGDARHHASATRLLRSFGALLNTAPQALGEMLLALDFAHAQANEIVLLRPQGGDDSALLDLLRQRFLPHAVLVRCEEGAHADALAELSSLVRGRSAIGGAATAYVCREGACGLPATASDALVAQLLPRPR